MMTRKKLTKRGLPRRRPDVDAATFNLWLYTEEEAQEAKERGFGALIEIYEGEKFYESRTYPGVRVLRGYLLLILSKIDAEGRITFGVRVKRPDGMSAEEGRKEKVSREEYLKAIELIEGSPLMLLFDLSQRQVTPGRLVNIYVEGGEGG
jgi:hypothetical protein